MTRQLDADEAHAAALFAHAAATLAQEAMAAIGRLGPDVPAGAAAIDGMAQAAQRAEELERLASGGANLADAYESAAQALQSAALALAQTRDTPWVHRVPAKRRVKVDRASDAK